MRKVCHALLGALLCACSVVWAGVMPPNTTLYQGQSVFSDNGRYFLIQQTDGNLVMYRTDGVVRFATYRYGHRTVMQGDGQFVEYSASNQPLWFTGTAGNYGAFLAVQDDGNLVVYSSSGRPLWSIGADPSPSDPRYAGDVVGRDMSYYAVALLGHLGIWTGSQVVEVGPGGTNAIKYTSFSVFKNSSASGASGYWGAVSPRFPNYNVYDCYETDCTNWRWLKPYGQTEAVSHRQAIVRAAYQAYLLGADYTAEPTYANPLPRDGLWPAQRGWYRCDSFVVAMYRKTVVNWNPEYGVPIDSTWQYKMDQLFSTARYPRNVFDKLGTFQ